ncbi:ANTAR domain-containing protein [Nocardia arthritidis]|uniref:histidine kinase n=1 Tax=Nocardia arthritidis TaxID=228602 RepID=A0A6G9YMG5_9NOCA|nr:ANTAR domain-containing protein [Nocardia arthritidis]
MTIPPERTRHDDRCVSDDGVPPQTMGTFSFRFSDQRWEWSDEVARMHGYQPGSVRVTTELVLSHKHPEDRAAVTEVLDLALRTGAPFSSRHRIVDTAGNVHHMLVVADRMFDESDALVGTHGYYVDLTGTLADAKNEMLQQTLPELVAARAVIEQAKGVLMRIYRINAEQAFRVLSWRSQETNTKLRVLAAQIIDELDTIDPVPPDIQSQFDHLLLTAHERVPGSTADGRDRRN